MLVKNAKIYEKALIYEIISYIITMRIVGLVEYKKYLFLN